ncbi:MAG: phage shock protein PspA [Sphingomonadales bacterium]|nr:phage shock protein PspA [Sphingomonadales bacterium]
MGIFSRLTDIVNSELSSILDKAENPEKIIRMVIQEMEDTLVEVRTSAARTIADQKDITRKLKRLTAAQADWEAKAELALSKGREDLAKAALVEKSKVAEMEQHLSEELEHLQQSISHHDDDVQKLEGKLREARAKKAALNARHSTATNKLRVRKNLYDGRIEDAFGRFDKVEQRMDRMEAESESYELGKGRTLAEEIGDLETDEAIESELTALKSKMKKTEAKKTAPKKAK